VIRVHLAGPHATRTPLSYAALWPLFAPHLAREPDPEKADLLIFAHFADLAAPPAPLVAAWRRRRPPVLLLSEEPFWDSLFSPDPLARDLMAETSAGLLPVTQINHHTSGIYRFDRIPYFLLTDHGFSTAYAARFRRNAARSAADWRADFARRPLDSLFMAERRIGAIHDMRFPEGDILGLCAWRTGLALAASGRVERLGASWQGGATRFALRHWHLDKLVHLDGRARAISAVENTHQPDYVSEKLFDAFACGARPLYVASARHRVHGLGLPAGAWANLWGLDPAEAAATLAEPWPPAFLDDFREAQAMLAALFRDLPRLVAERERLARAVLAEIAGALG